MKRLMNIFMLSCKKSSELTEKELFMGLNFLERIQLALHRSMCKTCAAWKKQSAELDTVLANQVNNPKEDSSATLSEEAKKSIIAKLEK
jgi:hypothetical protein